MGEEDTSPKTFEEFFEQLLPTALKAGIGIKEYWDYTLAEIQLLITAKNEQLQEDHKLRLGYDYNLARLVSLFVGQSMAGETIPSIEEVYPELYTKQQPDEEDEQKQLDYQLMMFTALANRINKERAKQ